jgi:tetratricopeptide (TPR) repeat protein
MDCPDCEAILDELLRGELPARREAEARSHLAICAGCRAKHMRRLRIAEMTAVPKTTPVLARLTWPGRLWRRLRPKPRASEAIDGSPDASARLGLLGRLATAPQVAMSSVMLLIVLVGLWSLPQLTRRRTPRFTANLSAETLRAARSETEVSAALTAAKQNESAVTPVIDEMSPPPAAAKRPELDGSNDLEAGLVHYNARQYSAATPLLSRALITTNSEADRVKSLLYLARAERALGHCERAVNSYSTLVRVHAARSEAEPALREGVACFDQLAEPGHAEQLLEQAANAPSLAATARSLAAQRQQRRSNSHTGDQGRQTQPKSPAP